MVRRAAMGTARTCLLFLAVTCAAGQPDFRKAVWGMTQAQVKAMESGTPDTSSENDGERNIQYRGVRLGGLAGRAIYVFVNDRLVRAKYLFGTEHTELNDFIRDFRSVEPLLVEKYGKPAMDRAIWEDDSTQLEPKSYLDQDRATAGSILPSDPLVGLAVSLGHLRVFTQWNASRTKITHSLTGQDHLIAHQVEYRDITTR
jgi:hypothetical protein